MTCVLLRVNNLVKTDGCFFKVENGDNRFLRNLANFHRTSRHKILENINIYLHRFWNSTSKSVMKVLEIYLTKILWYIILDSEIIFRKERVPKTAASIKELVTFRPITSVIDGKLQYFSPSILERPTSPRD